MSNNICVYTCITGDYDDVIDFPEYKDNDFDYYLFTNNKKITSTFWNVIYIDNNGLDNIRLARMIKILGHPILKKYDYTIWLDGASYPKKNISIFLNECCNLEMYPLIGFKHPERDCIYEECKACVMLDRESKDVVVKLYNYLKKKNYPEHNGLIESCILVRNNNDVVLNRVMKQWFDMILKFSYRDQLSFNYVAFKNNLKFHLLDLKGFDNDYFGRVNHFQNSFSTDKFKYCRLYFGKDYDYKNYDFNSHIKVNYLLLNDNKFLVEFICPCDGNEIKLELSRFSGIKLKNINVVNKIFDVVYINHVYFDDYIYFMNSKPNILLKFKYKKNEKIKINLDMQTIKEFDYHNLIDSLFYDINKKNILLQNKDLEIEKLQCEKMNAINSLSLLKSSFSWRITKPVRFFKIAFRKVVSIFNDKK